MPATAVRGQKLANELARMADRLEGKFRQAFLRSMLTVADDPELKKLIKEIQAGRFVFGDPIDSRLESVRINLAEMNEVARQAIAGSAKVTKDVLNLKGSFDVVNDSVLTAARNLSVDLSTYLRKSTKESLRQVIEDLIGGNISEAEAVRRIKLEVGLLPQHTKAVNNYRKTLLNTGTPRGKANQLAEQYTKRLLKYRANMIARTEVARATGIGQTEFWRQMRDQGALPAQANRVWITAMDERACDFCRSMDGQVATIDGGWDTPNGYMEYPQASHPHCRCSSGIVMSKPTKTGQMGRVAKLDEVEWEQWISKHLGGKHDQSTHGRGKTKSTPSFGDEESLFSGSQELQKSLPYDEKRVIEHYTTEGYELMNSYLRSGKSSKDDGIEDIERFRRTKREEQITLLDNVFEKTAVTCKRDMYLHRGMTLNVTKKEIDSSWVGQLKQGDVLTDKAFVSSSKEKGTAGTFATSGFSAGVIFTIKVPKGTRAMAGLDSESELILNRGTKMKVVEVRKIERLTGDFKHNVEVEMEIVP